VYVLGLQLLANQESQTAAHATMTTESKGTTTTHDSDDPDGAISWLRSKLHTVDQRCNTLQSDLKKAQQVPIVTSIALTIYSHPYNYADFPFPRFLQGVKFW
jgi:hypothetical protein